MLMVHFSQLSTAINEEEYSYTPLMNEHQDISLRDETKSINKENFIVSYQSKKGCT